MRTRGVFLMVLAAAAALLLVGRTVTALLVDHAWFSAMGVPALFWEQVVNTVLLQGGAWIVGSLFAFANLHAVRSTILAVAVPSRVANIELTAMVPGRRLLSATVAIALVVGAVLAWPLNNWEDLLLVRHGLRFAEMEGIFDRDLSHYMYWLPFEETMYLWSLVSLVSMTAMVLVLYALTRSLRLEGRRIAASTHVRRHLSVLGSLVLLLLAWSYRLDAFDLLMHGSGPDGMFLRVDHRITLRMDTILSYGCVVAALVVLRAGWVGQLRTAFVALTAVLISAVGLRHVAPAVAARAQSTPETQRRDADYVASRALFSRRAYNVDAMRIVAIDTATLPTARDRAAANRVLTPVASIVGRTSLWDRAALSRGLGESGEAPASNSALPPNSPTSAPTVAGAAPRMVDATPVGWRYAEGRVLALRVRRPVAGSDRWTLASIDVTRPMVQDSLIDLPNDLDVPGAWPLVGPGLTEARQLDATSSPDVVGVPLNSVRARVAHAWALRDVSVLPSDSLRHPAPIIVTHRDVRERLQKLAPVFVQGQELQPLLDGGRLYWALHLYSASDRYPLSQRWQVGGGQYSYFKLAATALVDAASGRTQLVPASTPDPLTRTWMTRFPTLFTADSALPASLAGQLPPASEGAVVQVRTFARYGSRHDGGPMRHLPDSALVGGIPAPVAMGIEGAGSIGWSLPLLDAGEQVDGTALVVGGSDRATYWLPAKGDKLRWRALESVLQAGLDSARAALPEGARRDSRLRSGRIEPLATNAGVLYLQSVQWVRGDGSVVVARVAVTNGAQVGVGATLSEALARMGVTGMLDGSAVPAPVQLVQEPTDVAAARWYDSMRQAMRRGDWSAFGAAFDSLGRVLGRPPQ
ncbi:MAG: UPF0182 family protein [Gemmatimonadaceae bacterium]|nr:UPF0182 family protein [Gemmatimonadaceae bacterium]